ncbi:phage baseplate assembly protein V [Pseudomonas sp. ICMP22404]|uniref:phage baseplate assembly protein V n=1 Tax=Pseudomonas TaxID=286 RepID=UPI001117BB21|nr:MULTISPECIES: phage baseplate assembly protein V [Pseudomonas]MCI0994523.1 phage baseplate assembly protein V [Pseudomonas corrugata]NUT68016.1 phage baseplate assembly protein V [Pseudomonas corrugata]TNF79316.1 phage baseplate assembly protein V [Pseudomonas sp. ICMP22404]
MNDLPTLTRLIENLIRYGTIAVVQMKPPRVRVKTGTLTTAWLPWIALRAGADREWNPPTENEQVILFSPSGQLVNGVVLTGLFSDHIPANADRDCWRYHGAASFEHEYALTCVALKTVLQSHMAFFQTPKTTNPRLSLGKSGVCVCRMWR